MSCSRQKGKVDNGEVGSMLESQRDWNKVEKEGRMGLEFWVKTNIEFSWY